MNNYTSFLFAALILLCTLVSTQVDDEYRRKLAELMKHDGKKRVVTIVNDDVGTYVRNNDLVVVFFWIDGPDKQSRMDKPDMNFLEIVAKLMEGRRTVVGVCDIMINRKLARSLDTFFEGMMLIYNRGIPVVYFGQRTADVLTPYLIKMLNPPIIEFKKGDRKKFESIDLVRVIAYVNKDSIELQMLEKAALKFQPMIPFFVVTDAKIAKSMYLKKLNTIQLVKPFEKTVTFPSKMKISEESIVKFVKENKKERLETMRLENLHESWGIKEDEYLVLIFAKLETEGGKVAFSIAKSVSKHFEETKTFNFIWIDPTKFTSMVDYWRRNFEIDPFLPNIGVVDVHKQTSAWLEREGGDEEIFSLSKAKKWLSKVLKGEVKIKRTKNSELLKGRDALKKEKHQAGEQEEEQQQQHRRNEEL